MKALRKILFPFALVYDLVTRIRNYFFDRGIFESKSYEFPVIAVGNLSVGGTGKSPMIEYLIRLLQNEYKLATLSRGYRRKSKGFILASETSTADDLGDEPMQFHAKFPNCSVAVDTDRQNGITQLKNLVSPEVILLDDAYQHRKVKAGFYVLLTKYDELYSNDLILPAGNLRESSKGAKRADVIVVTKCPSNLNKQDQDSIIKKLKPQMHQKVFFAKIAYDELVYSSEKIIELQSLPNDFCLVTGIANPNPLLDHLDSINLKYNHLAYKDHHNFSTKEIDNLAKESILVTTEKDYMRLKDQLSNVYYLPIKTEFLSEEIEFNTAILSFIKKTH